MKKKVISLFLLMAMLSTCALTFALTEGQGALYINGRYLGEENGIAVTVRPGDDISFNCQSNWAQLWGNYKTLDLYLEESRFEKPRVISSSSLLNDGITTEYNYNVGYTAWKVKTFTFSASDSYLNVKAVAKSGGDYYTRPTLAISQGQPQYIKGNLNILQSSN